MNTKIGIGLLVVIVLAIGGYSLAAKNKPGEQAMNEQRTETMMKSDTAMMNESENMNTNHRMMDGSEEDEKMMQNSAEPMPESTGMMEEKQPKKEEMMEQKSGTYADYSPAALADATKDGGKAVLFFWASWCPACKSANEAFSADASAIPAGVTVLKTNYDTERELKTKYGVTYQHTFVQVDTQGNLITKWNGGDIAALTSNVK